MSLHYEEFPKCNILYVCVYVYVCMCVHVTCEIATRIMCLTVV